MFLDNEIKSFVLNRFYELNIKPLAVFVVEDSSKCPSDKVNIMTQGDEEIKLINLVLCPKSIINLDIDVDNNKISFDAKFNGKPEYLEFNLTSLVQIIDRDNEENNQLYKYIKTAPVTHVKPKLELVH